MCFLQLTKKATSNSTMPLVAHVVGMAYTPSCIKGEEVNNFSTANFSLFAVVTTPPT